MSLWWGAAFAILAAAAAFLASRVHHGWLWWASRCAGLTACPLLIVANAQLHAWPMVAIFGLAVPVIAWQAVRALRERARSS